MNSERGALVGLFRMRFRFLPDRFFRGELEKNRSSRPTRENRIYCSRTGSTKRRDRLLLWWSGAAKRRRAGCAALRAGPKRLSPR